MSRAQVMMPLGMIRVRLHLGPGGVVQLGIRPALQAHAAEDAALFVYKIPRGIELGEFSLIKDDQPVVVDNGFKTVSN